ncbi:MAG: zinc ribbon domain-containing protein [Candidatus Bathyarchaeia archaeon]
MSDAIEGFHPIGRWRGEGSGFVAATIRRHQAGHYWSSYYSLPAYATPIMYASSPYYSPYGYGGGYPAYFGYYSQPSFNIPPQTGFQQPSPYGMGACPNCGSPLQPYVNFCDRCGTHVR